jgi:hypothetical protein
MRLYKYTTFILIYQILFHLFFLGFGRRVWEYEVQILFFKLLITFLFTFFKTSIVIALQTTLEEKNKEKRITYNLIV